jgi:hypothetical protein
MHWHAHALYNLVFSASTGQLFSAGEEGVIVMWSQDSQQPMFIPRVAESIRGLAVTADGTRAYACCGDNQIKFIEVSQKTIRACISGLAVGAVFLFDLIDCSFLPITVSTAWLVVVSFSIVDIMDSS